jgi:hypothetical protein
MPVLPTEEWLDHPPYLLELDNALSTLCDNKAPGIDQLPGEVFKHGGRKLEETLHKLICKIWETGDVPQEWKNAKMITIFKKGDRLDCGNYRGISLLSIAGKLFARILLNRLIEHAEENILPEAQCGFRSERSTIDMIFTLKQVQEKCAEQNKPLYIVFVDFAKAFDTVHRDALWTVLKNYGCPDHFVKLIKHLHSGMEAHVSIGGNPSNPFPVENGVKQGCVLAPTLFSIYLAAVLENAFRGISNGVHIQTRPGADLFKISLFKAKSRCKLVTIREMMFADDTAFVAHSLEDIQSIITAFSRVSTNFGLRINLKKTEVLYQSISGTVTSVSEPVTIQSTDLNYVFLV